MKNLKLLSNTFFLILLLVSTSLMAETEWDVAAVFLGANDKPGQENFQKDIDQNILELARIKNLKNINLSIYREMPSKNYVFYPKGKKEVLLSSLLGDTQTGSIKINGDYQPVTRKDLNAFFKKSFSDKSSKKILIFYGHGSGPNGLLGMSVAELKTLLNDLPIKPDIIWFDSCFMANFEFLFEIRKMSTYIIASEEAEFSAGMPFQSLELLAQIDNARTASLMLAKTFIESYSYLLKGSQRDHVSESAATISVFDNKNFEKLIPGLTVTSEFIKGLNPSDKVKILKAIKNKFTMDDQELVDLGQLLIETRLINKDKNIDRVLTSLIRDLNIESVKKLKTNPRIKINPPVPGALMVYGFNNWQSGSNESSSLLPTEKFQEGPGGTNWPVFASASSNSYITPFSPGVFQFNYYWIHPVTYKILSPQLSYNRTKDIVETNSSEGLIVYSAYTQSIGTQAERYTGVNISRFDVVPSFDLFEMEFNQLTQWLSL